MNREPQPPSPPPTPYFPVRPNTTGLLPGSQASKFTDGDVTLHINSEVVQEHHGNDMALDAAETEPQLQEKVNLWDLAQLRDGLDQELKMGIGAMADFKNRISLRQGRTPSRPTYPNPCPGPYKP